MNANLPDKQINQSDRPGTYFMAIIVALSIILNSMMYRVAVDNNGYAIVFMVLLSFVCNAILLICGVLKLILLKRKYPQYKYGIYWLAALSPLIIQVIMLLALGSVDAHGC